METAPATSTGGNDALEAWRGGVRIRPVLLGAAGHSLHSYFNISPESPDGRWVLMFTSTRPDAQVGKIVVVERETGEGDRGG